MPDNRSAIRATGLERAHGEAVTQIVDPWVASTFGGMSQPRLLKHPLEDSEHGVVGQRTATIREEDGVTPRMDVLTGCQIPFERPACRRMQRQEPPTLAFGLPDKDSIRRDVAHVEGQHLGYPHAGRSKKAEQRRVEPCHWAAACRYFPGAVNQHVDLGGAVDVGLLPGPLRPGQEIGRRGTS